MYGVVQSIKLEMLGDGKTEEIDDVVEVAALAQRFVDQPFSARIRHDNDRLIVKDVKFAGDDLRDEADGIMMLLKTVVVGQYERTAPAPAMPTAQATGHYVY